MNTRLILKRHKLNGGGLLLEVWVLAGCVSIELSCQTNDGSSHGKWLQQDSVWSGLDDGQGPTNAIHQFIPEDDEARGFVANLLWTLDFNNGRRPLAQAAAPQTHDGTDGDGMDLLDAEQGMAWWNGLSATERKRWLEAAQSSRPADAWRAFLDAGALGRK